MVELSVPAFDVREIFDKLRLFQFIWQALKGEAKFC